MYVKNIYQYQGVHIVSEKKEMSVDNSCAGRPCLPNGSYFSCRHDKATSVVESGQAISGVFSNMGKHNCYDNDI